MFKPSQLTTLSSSYMTELFTVSEAETGSPTQEAYFSCLHPGACSFGQNSFLIKMKAGM